MSTTDCVPSLRENHDVELSHLPQHTRNITVDEFGQDQGLKNREQRKTSVDLSSPHEDGLNGVNASLGRTISDAYELKSYTVREEKQILKKLDRHLVLFLALLYMLSFLVRPIQYVASMVSGALLTRFSDIGNARIAGLASDLNLTSSQYAWLLTAFYITYILFEWMVLLYRIIPPHIYISLCVLAWGLVASLQSVVGSLFSLLMLRALLGICEAGFGPGVPFYLSFFFRRDELAFRTGLFVSAAPLASSFASSLAWLITKLSTDGPIAPWRLLFLLEGFPSVVIAIFAWLWIPDSPESANFLNYREKQIACTRLQSENGDDQRDASHRQKTRRRLTREKTNLSISKVLSILLEPKCFLTAFMFLCCNVAFSSMPVFLPTVINDMGYSAIMSQALTAPPYLFSFLMVLLIAKLSDKYRSRGLYISISAVLAAFGYTMMSISGAARWPNTVRYIFVFPTCAGFFSAITIIITWNLNNQNSDSEKGIALAILNIIGQCGPLIGAQLYPRSDGPYYVKGMTICAAFMCGVLVLAIVLRLVLIRENERISQWNYIAETGCEDAEPLVLENKRITSSKSFIYYI